MNGRGSSAAYLNAGKQIVGYVIKGDEWEVIGTRSPQDAQVSTHHSLSHVQPVYVPPSL